MKNCIDLHLFWMYSMMKKFNLISQSLLVLLKFQKSWNLIVWNQKFTTPKIVSSRAKKISKFISWYNRVSKLLQSEWGRVFWAITQNGECGIKNYYIFCWRLVLRNSKDKHFSEHPILGPFFSNISKSEFSQKLFFCA